MSKKISTKDFLTAPEIRMLNAFGNQWEEKVKEIYAKIYKAVDEKMRTVHISVEESMECYAIETYFKMKGFMCDVLWTSNTIRIAW